MLNVQMANGQTETFDLCQVDDQRRWSNLVDDPKKCTEIRAVGVQHDGMWHTLPAPKKFSRVKYQAWVSYKKGNGNMPASLRVRCQADDISILMVLYYPNGNSPRMVRTTIQKTGRQVFTADGGKDGPKRNIL